MTSLASVFSQFPVALDTLLPGDTLCIYYDVSIKPFPPSQTEFLNQVKVSGSNFSTVLSDDPEVGGSMDPTATMAAFPVGDIAVVGNGMDIPDGDITPDPADGTDMGLVKINNTIKDTFYIKNVGVDTFRLDSIRVCDINGSPAQFTVLTPGFNFGVMPDDTLSAGDSIALVVCFTPTVLCADSATIKIYTSDFDEGVFDFQVKATGDDTKVTNTNDNGCGSLRQAVAVAMPGDTICFDSSIDGMAIKLATEIILDKDLVILGNDSSITIIDGMGTSRIFQNSPGNVVSVEGVKMQNGNATGGGGAILNYGDLTLKHCAIMNNTASGSGGGIYSSDPFGISNLDILMSCIAGNVAADQGGGAYLGDQGEIILSIISGNTANQGGGLYLNEIQCDITDAVISGNSADDGGGIYYYQVLPGGGSSFFTNVTIAGNGASASGGGVLKASNTQTYGYNAILYRNSIIATNTAPTGPDVRDLLESAFGQNCLIGDGSDQTTFTDGSNNNKVGTTGSELDPKFIAGVPSFPSSAGNLRLQCISPAIDMGDDASSTSVTDLDGNTRNVGTIDMGAFEHQSPVLEIFEIQGSGLISPFVNQLVCTEDNVVTCLATDGFFIQTPTMRTDADMNTSDGIFVFTGAAPIVAVGDLVDVDGTVEEFFDFTRLGSSPVVTITGTGGVPAAVILDSATPSADPTTPSCGTDNFECLEGMRVSISGGTVVGPNQRFTVDPIAEVFVTAASDRTFREPGIEFPGLPMLPVWDGNPEIFELDPDKLGLPNQTIPAGSSFDATGVLGYEFGGYELWPQNLTVTPSVIPVPVPDALPSERTVATLNLFRLFDDIDDPPSTDAQGNNRDDFVVSTAEYQRRRTKFAKYIIDVLKSPDVLAVQEAENLKVLQDLAADIATMAPSVVYTPQLVEGNDPGTIDVGFLVRASRFQVDAVTQLGKTETFTDPTDSSTDLVHDRPPLLLVGSYLANGTPALPVAVMNVHIRSQSGIDDPIDGPRVRAKRQAQVQSIAQKIQDFQIANPGIGLAVAGDFNDFQFTDGYVDVIGEITGDLDPLGSLLPGSDVVNPDLVNQTNEFPADERYTFIFRGNAQAIDHILTSSAITPIVSQRAYGRGNADAAVDLINDDSTPLRSSDHDAVVLYVQVTGEIEVVGNNTIITNGDTSPEANDGTDFGEICVTKMDSFYIKNIEGGDLIIDTIKIDGKGSNAGAFTFNSTDYTFPDTIKAGDSLLLKITFMPTTNGADTVIVCIGSNDIDEDPFTFTIAGIRDITPPTAMCQDITVQLDASGNVTITAAQVDNGSNDACGIQSLSVSPSTFTCANVGVNTVTLTVTDNNGNVSMCTSTVTVEDNVDPTAMCQDITVQLDASGNASITASQVDNGSNDACGIQSMTVSPNAFTCANVGANTVTLTVTDNNGNVSMCTSTVTVEDNVDPTAMCQDRTVQLDASGNATITAAQVDNGSNDACGIQSLSVSPSTFTCANVGVNTVTLTVTDNNGNVSMCTSTVTVEDNVDPTAMCQDITVQLDASGNASITASQVDNGSNDACGIQSMTVSPNAFTCANVGANTVTLTVTDNNGNVSMCTSTVTVEDNVDPTAMCQDRTVQLDASGNATITAAQVDNGSMDACGIQSLSVSPNTFKCTDVGANTVTLTVTDNNGNVSMCTATVTVEDNVDPTAMCQDITVQLDASGNASITAAQVDNGSSDACGIQSLSVSPNTFNCANVGANTVVLTVIDVNGNSSTCQAIVTVEEIGFGPDPVSGPQTVCPGLTGLSYSIPPQAYAAAYNWSYTGTGVFIANNGSNQVTVDYAEGATPGLLLVQAVTVCGSIAYESQMAIAFGSSVFCQLASCLREVTFVDDELLDLIGSLDVYKASVRIESDATIPGGRTIIFIGGQEIVYYPGFTVPGGSGHEAQIYNCVNTISAPGDNKE